MISTVLLSLSLLGLVGLGMWCKKLLAKVARLKVLISEMQVLIEKQKKQLDIAAKPASSPDDLLKRMRDGKL